MTGTRSSSSRCRTERVRRRLQQAFWSLYGRFVWDAEQPSWRQAQIERVVAILASRRTRPAECVLDAGCGTGNYAIALAQAGFEVVGIDYATGMLAHAQAKLSGTLSDRLSFQRMDLDQRLDLADASFDHVINISVLQNAADPDFTLRELQPGARGQAARSCCCMCPGRNRSRCRWAT